MNARPPAWVGPRGIAALAGLALVAGVFARVLPWPLVLGGAAVAALAAFAADARAIARGPAFTRAIPAHLMLARRAEFTYSVVNRAAVPLHFAIFEAPIERLEVGAAPARGSVPPAGRTVVRIGVLPRERGRTQAGLAFGWFESPLGLIRRRVRIGSVEALRIRPDLSALERGGDLALRSRLLDAGLRRVRRRGFGSEFESLREYAGGDAFRTIDWKATARRGKVMVAQYEVERSQQIVVATRRRAADERAAGRSAQARLRGLDGTGDRVVRAGRRRPRRTACVRRHDARRACAAQRRAANGSADRRAGRSRAAIRGIRLRTRRARIRRRFRKRSLIVIFTDLFDPVASGAVLASLALLAPHHLVLVVLMNDAAIADALQREPATAGDVYRAGIATTLAAERDRAAAALRARGIGVIDVPARDLSLALLDAYVEVKTRSLL